MLSSAVMVRDSVLDCSISISPSPRRETLLTPWMVRDSVLIVPDPSVFEHATARAAVSTDTYKAHDLGIRMAASLQECVREMNGLGCIQYPLLAHLRPVQP